MDSSLLEENRMDVDNQFNPPMDAEFKNLWTPIHNQIKDFLMNPASQISVSDYMKSYSSIYEFCTKTPTQEANFGGYPAACRLDFPMIRGSQVYNSLRQVVSNYCIATMGSSRGIENENLIHFYASKWAQYLKLAKIVDHMMSYLNRVWVPQSSATRGPVCRVFEMVLRVWRDLVFSNIFERLTISINRQIDLERSGGPSDDSSMKTAILSYLELDFSPEVEYNPTLNPNFFSRELSERCILYRRKFEDVFLTTTAEYYEAESLRVLEESSVSDYVRLANSRLAEEDERITRYLIPVTKKPLISLCQAKLIRDHEDCFLEELYLLLKSDSYENVRNLFVLVSNIPGLLEPLRHGFEMHVRKYGLEYLEQLANTFKEAKSDMKPFGEQIGSMTSNMEKDNSCSSTDIVSSTSNYDNKQILKDSKLNDQGQEINVDAKTYVEAILSVRNKFVLVVGDAFNGDQGFMASMDKACREFVNSNIFCRTSSRSPELIAKYTDLLLKRSSTNKDDDGLEKELGSVLMVFKYIEDKDVFQKFYSKMLCKRLVNQNSESDEMERWMISRLKDLCGFEFTSKLQRMFTDIDLSKDLNNGFREFLREDLSRGLAVDFHIIVMSTASWPLGTTNGEFTLPPELLGSFDRFLEYYNGRFNGRRLKWLYNQSRCEMKAQFDPSRPAYTLQVNMYQMKILMLFNDGDSFTLSEMQSSINSEQQMLEANLTILVKAKILNLTAASDNKNSRYAINLQYRNKKMRINLNVPIRADVKTESDQTHKTIEDDRRFLVQASIVRVMKTRRVLKHAQLVQEVLEQLTARFRPTALDIKKAVSELISKQYLERLEEQKDIYSYVA